MSTNKKIKVLQVLGGLWSGGTEAFVMNMYRSIDREKVEFDFLIHEQSKAHYDDEVLSLGGEIYRIPGRHEVGTIKYTINLVRILRKIKPDVVHSHAMFNSGVVMFAAFLAGIKKRVAHAHSSRDETGNHLGRMGFRFIMRSCLNVFSTDKAACTVEAADFLFKAKNIKKSNVQIINNGIDVDRFQSITTEEIINIRNELNISEKNYVIGFVGRLVDVKNPLFIIKLFEKIHVFDNEAVLVIVGDGPLKIDIERELDRIKLTNHVRLIGNRRDIPSIMSVFDILVLPSLFEGLGIVAIEAQAKGLPCILSDNVPKTADLGLKLVHFISLEEKDKWINLITCKQQKLTNTYQIRSVFNSKGYEIKSSSQRLLKVYDM